MKYIITYEKFQDSEINSQQLEVKANMIAFNKAESDIAEFKNKKNSFLDIYKKYTKDENSTDLYNKLLQGKFIKSGDKKNITFLNPLFGIWSNYCNKVRELDDYINSQEAKKKELLEKQKSLNNNQGDRETLLNDIKNIQTDISSGNSKISEMTSAIDKLKKSSDDELKSSIKKLEEMKQRIIQSKNPL